MTTFYMRSNSAYFVKFASNNGYPSTPVQFLFIKNQFKSFNKKTIWIDLNNIDKNIENRFKSINKKFRFKSIKNKSI